MRIFNGKNKAISVPMIGSTTGQKLELDPMSVSGNLMPTTEFLQLLTRSFSPDEVAIIIAGAFEYNVCANINNLAMNFCVSSLDEAIERFHKKTEPTPVEKMEAEEKKVEVEEPVIAEPEVVTVIEEEPAIATPEPEPEATVEVKKTKRSKKNAE